MNQGGEQWEVGYYLLVYTFFFACQDFEEKNVFLGNYAL
jgi:hypothetical protein